MFSSLNVPSLSLIPLSLLPLAHPTMAEREGVGGFLSGPLLGCIIPKAVVTHSIGSLFLVKNFTAFKVVELPFPPHRGSWTLGIP